MKPEQTYPKFNPVTDDLAYRQAVERIRIISRLSRVQDFQELVDILEEGRKMVDEDPLRRPVNVVRERTRGRLALCYDPPTDMEIVHKILPREPGDG